MHGSPQQQAEARERYLTLLRSGGSDHPMALLKKAGVDLSQPDTVLRDRATSSTISSAGSTGNRQLELRGSQA